ncbi:kinase-like protein [Tylopilus felleus]
MYNLATQIAAMSRDLDGDKKGSLGKIQTDASNVLSLSSTIGLRGTPGNTMDSIPERTAGSAGPQDEDDLGVFEAEDIQSVLRQMNYTIEFIPWGHPHLAVIVNKFDETHGYLKFVQRENEFKVLRYLSEIESPSNHTIYGVQFWPVQGGTVISMPVAGGWLTSLDNPSDQLWSVAQQLVEGVAFMHEHNVAHMDLKPQNVIIPVAGGRLSIIDFSVSIRVPSADATYNGVAGTEDYIAPEVRKGNYKPMLADLWSCGRTLEELCGCCHPSAERTALLKIAKRLMNRDPEARPKMSDVLEQMAPSTRRRGGNAAPSTLPRALAPSVPALGA